MKLFQCDKCKTQSQSEMEQFTWRSNGEERWIDVCPACRDEVKNEISTHRKGVLNLIYDNK